MKYLIPLALILTATTSHANGGYTYSYDSILDRTEVRYDDGRRATIRYDDILDRTEVRYDNGESYTCRHDRILNKTTCR